MSDLVFTTDPRVARVFADYPDTVRPGLEQLRAIILAVARSDERIGRLDETLKWGEPSYLTPHGSTLRIAWKRKSPNQYALYFKCTSRLVPTIKSLFGDTFRYETSRAILFRPGEKIPEQETRACIRMALNYHRLKHLPTLGE
ncbi:uncharacterized protein DUF1801 [Neolewinella xylanilytica]|uniref:Uncharacterized protein DUF1801 n=1 Tax=Neolewinella xylanilytica TaxID=1514080 RepID=A0A2S6I038_9BACT|nr:DUF1801 domain-containing protein [Neolewinella xylanilytica]PPK84226.1 uncharacterized protein DUF1801 [Neolewinella xylanilytica]